MVKEESINKQAPSLFLYSGIITILSLIITFISMVYIKGIYGIITAIIFIFLFIIIAGIIYKRKLKDSNVNPNNVGFVNTIKNNHNLVIVIASIVFISQIILLFIDENISGSKSKLIDQSINILIPFVVLIIALFFKFKKKN
ncbi:MAG: hypothetical protein WC867_05025 [Candidatus Pacearchaeota archaeon]|jgi:hypothetical protein